MKQWKDLSVTFSEFGQDGDAHILITNILKEKKPFFVDVGAYDGKLHSNTLALENEGWDGILFEPNPTLFALINENKRKAKAFQYAISNKNSEKEKFFIYRGMHIVGALYEPRPEKECNIIYVQTKTLCEALEIAEAPQLIHFLSVDTERNEFNIMSKYFEENEKLEKPYEIIFCSLETCPHCDRGRTSKKIFDLMSSHQYQFLTNNRNDDYYILKKYCPKEFKLP